LSGAKIILLGVGGSSGSPQIGGADGAGDWGQLDPGEPRNRRTRPSIVVVAADGRRLLVDTGPDLRAQLMDNKIPRVDAVFYTHAHADHIAGLDEVRILNRILGTPMPAYADAATWADLLHRFDYAFKPWTGPGFFRPAFLPHTILPGESHEIIGLPVEVIGQDHGFLSSLGLRIGNAAYCTDVKILDETALERLQNLDLFIVDCFTRTDTHPTHPNLAQVSAWVERLRPKRTVLTHMGPSMEYRWLVDNLPPGIEPGYDGMVLDI
jgi:phosphoribosyl 1,2-cyclic phosphate phosphodiesterase